MIILVSLAVLLLAVKGLQKTAQIKRIISVQEQQKRAIASIQKNQQSFLAEQKRQAAEIAKHEKQIQKHEEEIHKLNYRLNKAENDIDFLLTQLDHFKDYGKYLELERDACIPGSSNWHKWNNKLNTNDAKVYRLSDQLGKAYEEKQTAIRKLEVA